ncbi:MAG: hypothetical protein JO055_13330 [Alphaproteobacteria bacterium]|nr:hypothetical protein [Alphaproteobacteria bacterium]
MNFRPIAVWFMIIVAECVNGLVRALFLEAPLGDRVTHQLGVAVGSFLVIAIALASSRWMQVRSTAGLIIVGALWMVLTFVFDVGLGVILIDGSFERVMADYDPRRGGLMLLGMAVLGLAPFLAATLRGIRRRRAAG